MRLRARFFSIYYYTLYRCIFQQSFHTRQVFISSRFYKVIHVKLKCNFPLSSGVFLSPFPLAREPTVTAWRGTTLSTRIDRYRSLIMPPRFVRQAVANNTAQSLVQIVKLGVRYGRRRCGSNSVFK